VSDCHMGNCPRSFPGEFVRLPRLNVHQVPSCTTARMSSDRLLAARIPQRQSPSTPGVGFCYLFIERTSNANVRNCNTNRHE